jgi:hypothetical protein
MIEEKQTDVNLALQIYRDAALDLCDQQVICSNDSDMEPAINLVQQDFPKIKIGLIVPLRPKVKSSDAVPNKRLTKNANWVRHHILDNELARSLLPNIVPTNKKPARKPQHW